MERCTVRSESVFLEAALTVIGESRCRALRRLRRNWQSRQTLRHQPDAKDPFSLQVGDADIIASGSGIPTVANFQAGRSSPSAARAHPWCRRFITGCFPPRTGIGLSSISAASPISRTCLAANAR